MESVTYLWNVPTEIFWNIMKSSLYIIITIERNWTVLLIRTCCLLLQSHIQLYPKENRLAPCKYYFGWFWLVELVNFRVIKQMLMIIIFYDVVFWQSLVSRCYECLKIKKKKRCFQQPQNPSCWCTSFAGTLLASLVLKELVNSGSLKIRGVKI